MGLDNGAQLCDCRSEFGPLGDREAHIAGLGRDWRRKGWPQMPPFGTMIRTLSSVTSSVQNRVSSLTAPRLPPIYTLWPILKGRKISSMTPAARLESVPCKETDRRAGSAADSQKARHLDAELRQHREHG